MRQSYHEGPSFKQIRSVKVMPDFDLAEIYGFETKNFNRQVKNNKEKFPEDMKFQL
ncbi:MAG: ORF6N domain-containing protein, partial [Spirochaetales bacterium]|nr:ORF6N domain-containing protein [Spirochaetales bacterium]